jgi:hypothetical protein
MVVRDHVQLGNLGSRLCRTSLRLAQPDTLLGLHDPGQPWAKWGCPIDGCGHWFPGPWYLEGHNAAEHPG